MKKKEAATILKHIQKDDKEFRGQIKDDKKLEKKIKKGVSAKKEKGKNCG